MQGVCLLGAASGDGIIRPCSNRVDRDRALWSPPEILGEQIIVGMRPGSWPARS